MESGMRRTTRSQSRIQQHQSSGAAVEENGGALQKVATGKGESVKKQQPRRALADVTNGESSPLVAARSLKPAEECEGGAVPKSVEDSVEVQVCQVNGFDPFSVDEAGEVTDDDERASNWSVAVNVSSPRRRSREESDGEETDVEADEEDEEEEEDEAEEAGDEEKPEDDFESELCKSMKSVSLNQPRHFRYKYNSDDEEIFEMEEVEKPTAAPPAVKLNGLPTPAGKHIRFDEDGDEKP